MKIPSSTPFCVKEWICLKLRCDAVSFLDRINRIDRMKKETEQ